MEKRFVEIFGHSPYNNGNENSFYQQIRNIIQIIIPLPAQYFSLEMKDKIYCYTVCSESEEDSNNTGENSSLIKPKHF